MRFDFMGGDGRILTKVSVNPLTKKVRFTNFTDDPIDRAFGVKESATYQDVLDFFERRTFARNRSDIDGILNAMGLKEYDPYKMCRKLEGRRAQDEKWIRFRFL